MSPRLSWILPRLAIGGVRLDEDAGPLVRLHGVRSVVDLRDGLPEGAASVADGSEADHARLHLPTPDLAAPSSADLERGVAFVAASLARGHAVFIHCEYGIGRSATLALCALVDGGMAPLAAVELVKDRREIVSPSPPQYEAFAAFVRTRGREPPDFESFTRIVYRHLHTARAAGDADEKHEAS